MGSFQTGKTDNDRYSSGESLSLGGYDQTASDYIDSVYGNQTSAETVQKTDPLTGPAGIDTSYVFGDFLTGSGAAKEQAQNQAILDYAQWVRSEHSAQNQRDWEREMANTQVQRAMKDLSAAGLNPWLAVQSAGFGNNVPTGASANSAAGQASSGKGGGSALAGLGTAALGIASIIKAVARYVK